MTTTERPTWHETRFAMARAVARRSLCVRDQVGSIIVDVNNKVIGEGHNGPPRGFEHNQRPCTEWCLRAQTARDGSNVVNQRGEVVLSILSSDYSECPALHSEANCLLMSDRTLRAGGTIYVTSHICHGCAKLIANSGLGVIRVEAVAEHPHRSSAESYNFLVKCGLTVVVNGEEKRFLE